MDNIKVSIIVPVYNVEKYLQKCIDSLVNQTLPEIEIILINDGSTDNSFEICKTNQIKYSNIILENQTNKGQSSARNKGMEKARGKYILFVDSDDYIIKETCQNFWEIAEKYNLDIVHGDILNEKDEITNNPKYRKIKSENEVITGLQYINESTKNLTYDIVPWLNFVKKDYLVKNNNYFLEGYFYEDQHHTFRLFCDNSSRMMKIRFPFYFYRMDREGSTTNHTDLKKYKDLLYIVNKMHEDYFQICKNNNTGDYGDAEVLITLAYYQLSRLWLKLNRFDQNQILDNKENVLNFSTKKTTSVVINTQLFLFEKMPTILRRVRS